MPLEYLKKGEHITAEHYHEVTRAAKAQAATGGGYSDADGFAVKPQSKLPSRIQVYSTVAIAKNSVFQIGVGTQTDDITVFNVQLVDNATNKVLCTNEESDLNANAFGYATVIPFDRPIKVKANAYSTPVVLAECGVASTSFLVSSGQTGLICLSLPDANNMIEVIARSNSGPEGGKIWFRVLEVSHYVISGTVPGCEFVRAEVTQVSCETTSVSVGNEIMVFDPHFCWFNIPLILLMRFEGTATLAKKGNFNMQLCGVTVPDCFWAVDSACCLEEVYGS